MYKFLSKGKTVKSIFSAGDAIDTYLAKASAQSWKEVQWGLPGAKGTLESEPNSSLWRNQEEHSLKVSYEKTSLIQIFLVFICDHLNFTFVMKNLQSKLRM